MEDNIDYRYLGALRFVDKATGFQLKGMLDVVSNEATIFRNRSNLYVIKTADGLEKHNESFDYPPDAPAIGSIPISVQINDPLNHYLPRTIDIDLPRDPTPENFENDDSLFNPVKVSLYVTPNARVSNNWSTVRVSVIRDGTGLPVAGALLRVIRSSDSKILSSGMSDERGEALIIVPGVKITQFAEDSDLTDEPSPVVVSELSVRLEVSVDPGINPDSDIPTNPDLLELNHVANLVDTKNLTLRTGKMEKKIIKLP